VRDRPLPGAVLTRVAASHLRVGTFQYFGRARRRRQAAPLADYAIARHDPALAGAPTPYLGLLQAVAQRQAALIAQWMNVGFIHGVMNTDNMTLSGETIDYGPCAFMEAYDPARSSARIDHGGRYAYGNQPLIARWNLARLAETLLPLLADEPDRGGGARHGGDRRLPGLVRRRSCCRASAPSWAGTPADGRRRAGDDWLALLQAQAGRLHAGLAPPGRCRAGDARRCARCLPTRRAGSPGWMRWRERCAGRRRRRRSAPSRCAASTRW
jgi:hypothetical protein